MATVLSKFRDGRQRLSRLLIRKQNSVSISQSLKLGALLHCTLYLSCTLAGETCYFRPPPLVRRSILAAHLYVQVGRNCAPRSRCVGHFLPSSSRPCLDKVPDTSTLYWPPPTSKPSHASPCPFRPPLAGQQVAPLPRLSHATRY